MKVEKYNLNEETLNFILDFEKKVEKGKVNTNKELVKLLELSSYYKDIVLLLFINVQKMTVAIVRSLTRILSDDHKK
ncbi:hypothetical protein [Sporolactobacillus putidus]|uniref:Uncharacterized protein n=1 Tax=Sporolactobacillus putidus TaxID=492735 RepID=A0A917S5G9_9BACL|nr:hypothetical protein [Sporolactobacillus putidus]GGL60276.1 hypothetical protein GCM10007968_25360 [Sporolactobacillus putidus]